MAIVRVQRISMPKSGQPEDQTVNSLYFSVGGTTADPDATTCQTIATELDTLFNTAVGAGNAIRFYLAESTMATQRVTYKFYNMDNPSPRVPIAQPVAQNLTPVIATTPYPSELACCLSFRGLLISGVPAGRRRGRIFIGPLNTAASGIVSTGSGQPLISGGLQTALTAGANRLHDNLLVANITWGIYSPTSRGGGPALNGFVPITTCWVDDAFDVQRRRGVKATSRVTIDV